MNAKERIDFAQKCLEDIMSNRAKSIPVGNGNLDEAEIRKRKAMSRTQRSLRMIADPRNSDLYSMEIERTLITYERIGNVLWELENQSQRESTVKFMANILRRSLKSSLFGCEVNIGTCVSASADVLDFSTDTYRRLVRRGESTCFECLDQADIVLQSVMNSDAAEAAGEITAGESIVYVPLIGRAGPVGVIEIMGFVLDDITDVSRLQRSPKVLQAMLRAKDYRFKDTTRFWRSPENRSGGTIIHDEKAKREISYYARGNYQVVCGKVEEVATELNGVPFFGGPRYHIRWEDGLYEQAVTANQLIELYKNTPQSLGCSSKFDLQLADSLLNLGNRVGLFFEAQRRKDQLKSLISTLNIPSIEVKECFKRYFESVLTLVSGVREVGCAILHMKQEDSKKLLGKLLKSVSKKESSQASLSGASLMSISTASSESESAVTLLTSEVSSTVGSLVQSNVLESEHVSLATFVSGPKQVSLTHKIEDVILLYKDKLAKSPPAPFTYVHGAKFVFSDPICIPDGALLEWVICKLDLPGDFEYDERTTKVSRKVLKSENSNPEFFVYIIRPKSMGISAALEIDAMHDATKEVVKALICHWERELRRRKRSESLMGVEKLISQWRELSISEMCFKFTQIISEFVPGASVYIGLLASNASVITYVACNTHSAMGGKKLLRGQGISFTVAEELETKVLRNSDTDKRKQLNVGTSVDIQYGKLTFPARITRDCGHELFDVTYLPQKFNSFKESKEMGVQMNRIFPSDNVFSVKKFSLVGTEMPFVAIPLRNRAKGIGVLGIDSFGQVPIASYEAHPEPGLLTTLQQLGAILGGAIDYQRKKQTFKALSKISKNMNATPIEVFQAVFEGISSNFMYTTAIGAYRIIYEKSEKKKTRGSKLLVSYGTLSVEAQSLVTSFSVKTSSLKTYQKRMQTNYWILCKLLPPSKGLSGKIYLISIETSRPLVDCDIEFLETYQKIIQATLQNLESQKATDQLRFDALKEIKAMAKNSAKYLDKDKLFSDVYDRLQACFFNISMYVGYLDVHAREIRFVLANKTSIMKGKVLTRKMKSGICFDVVDNSEKILVTKEDEIERPRLYYFGAKEKFDYPFISFPVFSHHDSPLGVFCVDGVDEISADDSDKSRLDGVDGFFSTVLAMLSDTLHAFRLADLRAELKRIAVDANGYIDGIHEVKRVIMKLIPYSLRCVEVLYEPKLIGCRPPKKSTTNVLEDDFVYFVRITNAVMNSVYNVKNPWIAFFFNDTMVFRTNFKQDSSKERVFKVLIPNTLANTKIRLIASLMGTISTQSSEQEIGNLKLDLFYITNAPLIATEHFFYSPQLDSNAVAKMTLYSKLLKADSCVCLMLNSVACRNLAPVALEDASTDGDLSFYMVLLKNGSEIGRFESDIAQGAFPEWKNLKVSLSVDGDEMEQLFVIEIWNVGMMQRSSCVGTVMFTILELNTLFSSSKGSPWKGLINPHYTGTALGRLKIIGEQIIVNKLDAESISKLFPVPVEDEELSMETIKPVDLMDCELGVLMARDLLASGKFGASCDPFVTVYLNGDEIGKTAVVKDSTTPVWDDEYFSVKLPMDPSVIESTVLQIEIWNMTRTGRGEFLGCAEITGKSLKTLMMSPKLKKEWFDLQKTSKLKENQQNYVNGEIKLSGRPLKVSSANVEEAVDFGKIEIGLEMANKLSIFGSFTFYCTVSWNDKIIMKTEHFRYEVRGEKSSFTFPKSECKICVRIPNNRPLFSCQLDIKIIEVKVDHLTTAEKLLGNTEHTRLSLLLTGAELASLVAHPTHCRTKWYRLLEVIPDNEEKQDGGTITTVTVAADDLLEADKPADNLPKLDEKGLDSVATSSASNFTGEILIRAGPEGGQDLVEDDGREVWFDILCGSDLPQYQIIDPIQPNRHIKLKPSIYCVVFWNDVEVGRTKTVYHDRCPVFRNQRFYLRTPLLEDSENSLFECALRVEVYCDKQEKVVPGFIKKDDFLGVVSITGKDLVNFVGTKGAIMKWFNLMTSRNKDADTTQGLLKLRASFGGGGSVGDNPSFLSTDYKLEIVKAQGLARIDDFGLTNAYCIVNWNGEDVLTTETVVKSLDPEFSSESVILKLPWLPSQVQARLNSQSLILELWEKNIYGIGDFLGMINFSSAALMEFFDHELSLTGYEMSFPLEKNPTMSEENNQMVRGILYLKILKLKHMPSNLIITRFIKSKLKVEKAMNLPKADVFGTSDAIVYIYWSCSLLTNEMREIGRTSVVYNTLNPVWKNEEFEIDVPYEIEDDQEWNSLTLNIEVWDMDSGKKGDFLGASIIFGETLKHFLSRRGLQAQEPMEFKLGISKYVDPKKQELVKKTGAAATIVLSGGVKAVDDSTSATDPVTNKQSDEALGLDPGIGNTQKEQNASKTLPVDLLVPRSVDEVEIIPTDNSEQVGGGSVQMSLLHKEPQIKISPMDRIKISIVSANSLPKVSFLGSTFPYIVVTLNDVELGRTSIVRGQNPNFAETKEADFLLDKNSGIEYNESHLLLELYHSTSSTTTNPEKDVFLGQISLVSDILMSERLFSVDGLVLNLETSSRYQAKKQKYVDKSATVILRASVTSDIEPSMISDNNSYEALANYAIPEVDIAERIPAEIAILAATGLPSPMKFLSSKNELFCVFYLNGIQMGQSASIKAIQQFIFEDIAMISLPRTIPISQLSDMLLTIDLFYANGKTRTLIGSIEIRGKEILEFISQSPPYNHRKWFDVLPPSTLFADVRFPNGELKTALKPSGCVRLMLHVLKPSVTATNLDSSFDIEMSSPEIFSVDLSLRVISLHGLKLDRFGYSSVYVRVRCNNKIIGKTDNLTTFNQLVWEDEIFNIKENSVELADLELMIEVVKVKITGGIDIAGLIVLSGENLVNLVTASATNLPSSVIQLTSHEYFFENSQPIDGRLEFKLAHTIDLKSISSEEAEVLYDITVLRAMGLSIVDDHIITSAFYVIKVNDEEVSRSDPIPNTTSPTFEDDSTQISLVRSEIINSSLSIEFWNMTFIGKGEFLGGIFLKELDLVEFLDSVTFAPKVFDLKKSEAFDDASQIFVRGRSEILCQRSLKSKNKKPKDTLVSYSWFSERITEAGNPSLEITIISATDLYSANFLSNKSDPICVVSWGSEDVLVTGVADLDTEQKGLYHWKRDQVFITIKQGDELMSKKLKFSVFDMDMYTRGEFLGLVELSFASLLKLNDGAFDFNLRAETSLQQHVRGSIKIGMRIKYPFWDNTHMIIPTTFKRRIKVLSAVELPEINGQPPNTKCTLSINNAVKAKSTIIDSTVAPTYIQSEFELVLQSSKREVDVQVHVYYVDYIDRRDVCIGHVSIPFEMIIRPPKAPWLLLLGPPEKPPPKKYNLMPSGSVKIQIVPSDENHSSKGPFLKRELTRTGMTTPIAAYSCRDISIRDPLSKGIDDDPLDESELNWLGTNTDLGNVHQIHGHRNWIVIPIRAHGYRLGAKEFIGYNPGYRYALCIERPRNKLFESDIETIHDIYDDIQHAINKLRSKDFFGKLRALALTRLKSAISAFADSNDFDVEKLIIMVATTIMNCFPGCRLLIARQLGDSLNVNIYENLCLKETMELFALQAIEFECVGRNSLSLYIKGIDDLVAKNRVFCAYKRRFLQSKMPRLAVPLRSGDLSFGFFALEDFDVYCSGAKELLSDHNEVITWLETISVITGNLLYNGKEKKALKAIETYVKLWDSTQDGLIKVLLDNCCNVLQGFKLLEIWVTSSDYRIASIASRVPESLFKSGREIRLKNIKIISRSRKQQFDKATKDKLAATKAEQAAALKAAKAKSGGALTFSTFTNRFGFGKKKEKILETPELNTPETAGGVNDEILQASLTSSASEGQDEKVHIKTWLVLGVQYDGTEHCKILSHGLPEDTYEFSVEEIKIIVKAERDIYFTIYEIDESCNVLNESVGSFQLVTFKEPKIDIYLGARKSVQTDYDLHSDVTWVGSEGGQEDEGIAGLDAKRIIGFKINLKRATNLKSASTSQLLDPFCEVYWNFGSTGKGKKKNAKDKAPVFFARTKVKPSTLSPEFNETIQVTVPPESRPPNKTCGIIVEVYHMGLFGKGAFLGQVSLSLEALCTPPANVISIPLSAKVGLPAKKQTQVGGVLFLDYSVDLIEVEEVIGDSSSQAVSLDIFQLQIPSIVWKMSVPSLSLTVEKAVDLPRADLIGSSDPIALVYMGNNPEPSCKTKVISNNLNPVWNETFKLPFSVTLDPESTTTSEFPVFRVEIWDMDTLGLSDFLGQVEIGPEIYFGKSKKADFKLVTSPLLNSKKNKLVTDAKAKGLASKITLGWKLADQELSSNQRIFVQNIYGHLSFVYFLDVQVLNCRNIMRADRFGSSDPYCKLFVGTSLIGESSCKKKNLNPNWYNEIFSCNLSAIKSLNHDLRIEVWDKNMFTDEVFLGQIIVPEINLLHPDPDNVTVDLKPRPADPKAKVRGTITFKVVTRRGPQKYGIRAASEQDFGHQDSLKIEPLKLSIIPDPEEERKRQLKDGLNLPGIIKKANDDMEKYINCPFEKSGLISELHYGQALYSYQRRIQTIFKSDKADILCVPTGVSKTTFLPQETVTQKDTKKRSGSTKTTSSEPKSGGAVSKAVERTSGDLISVVCRYPAGGLPRRDMEFMQIVKSVLSGGLELFNARDARKNALNELKSHMKSLEGARDRVGSVIVQGIMDLEFCFVNVNVEIYIYDPIKNTFLQCSREVGTVISEKVAAPRRQGHDSVLNEEFLKYSSRLCRHGFMLQLYRGKLYVAGVNDEWSSEETHQKNLVLLDSVANQLKIVGEDKHMNKKLSTYVHREAINPPSSYTMLGAPAGGLAVVPLLVNSEVLIGMMVLRNLNKLPHAIYRIKTDSSEASKDGFHEIEGLEEGFLKCIRESSESIASGIISARTGDAVKELKAFTINKTVLFHAGAAGAVDNRGPSDKMMMTNTMKTVQLDEISEKHCVPELLLRFAFRQLASALPHLNEISVWRIDLNKNVQYFTKFDKLEVEKKRGIFGRLFGLVGFNSPKKAMLEEIENKTKGVEDELSMLSMSMENSLESGSTLSLHKPEVPISSGYFISENPKPLLNSENELVYIKKQVNRAEDSPFIVSPPYCFDLPKPESISDSIVVRDYDINMVFNEIVRRVKVLESKSFNVSSGHFLSMVDTSSSFHEQLAIMFEKSQKSDVSLDDESSFLSNSTPYDSKTGLRRPPLPSGGQGSKLRQRKIRPVIQTDFRYFLVTSATGLGAEFGYGNIGPATEKAVGEIMSGLNQAFDKLFVKNTEVNNDDASSVSSVAGGGGVKVVK